MSSNRRLVLRQRPDGAVTDETFDLVEQPVPAVGDGQVLVRTLWLAFEPAQRGWLNDVRSYVPPVAIGEVMRSWGLGQVVASRSDRFAVGELVHGSLGWQEWALVEVDGSDLEAVPPDLEDPTLVLSLLGITGLTAYMGMVTVGRPLEGDTVLVTAAAGSTGSIAGQIARQLGASTVIGTAGSEAKRTWVVEHLRFDDCLDHHDDDVRRAMRRSAPDGFDVVFDNVGGALLDAALFNIGLNGRIVLCGSISTGYRPERPEVGLHYYQLLTTRRARMEGFLVTDHVARYAEARARLLEWYRAGDLVIQHDVLESLVAAPEGLQRLFSGGNLGKQLLRLGDPA